MRRLLLSVLVFITLFGSLAVDSGLAQEIDRKIKSKIAPTYPEVARKIGLTGSVKLQLVIAANGTVKETKVIGGHPILVNAAVDAVKKWKFEPGPSETMEVREFKFEPGS